jgi:trk system potassium uptake protein
VIEADDEVFFVAAAQEHPRRHERTRKLDKKSGDGSSSPAAATSAGASRRAGAPVLREAHRARSGRRPTALGGTGPDHRAAGDAADEELLLEENIDDTDVFCAVTNDDR